ncbi:MAG: type II toxin-antitoxin system HipA family toxin [Pseudomonadales bacterium]
MVRVLDVYLHSRLVGKLIQSDVGTMKFRYDSVWLEGDATTILSHSLPHQAESFRAKQCLGFFGGILPEESKRERIAKNLGISDKNAFAMLAEIGGECAGAVTFLPEGQPLEVTGASYKMLAEEELEGILLDLPKRPLMAGEAGVRLSLAGAQDKITVHCFDERISVPLYGAPSTHIIKPAIERYKDTVLNEAVCMKLAKAIGLPVADVDVLPLGTISALSVKRFDRDVAVDGKITRLHQEDFCQALGIVSEMKYQCEGGVSLKQAFSLVRTASSIPAIDLQHLLDVVLFNFFIGNNDAHGKNFSLIYKNGKARLAPFYDLLSTVYYPELSDTMAMKIGGQYIPSEISNRHFERMAEEAGLSKPMVLKRIGLVADKMLSTLVQVESELPQALKLTEFIRGYIQKMRARCV